MTEAVEVCPHCMGENILLNYDVDKSGYMVKCNHCGREMMLCDECLHTDDNLQGKCDWRKTEIGGCCFRGETKEV